MKKKINKNWRILLSSILMIGNFSFYGLKPSLANFILYPSLFIYSILNIYLLLRESNRGILKKNLANILAIYLVQILFFSLIHYFVELNYSKEILKLDLHAKEILALRDHTSLTGDLVKVFLSWNRYILYENMFSETLDES